ncbi:Mbov_0397 family ICE element conjugal transfer ATPase [Mycoplasmopsis cynos]|uniref:Mbov_0397 family ICE element conjugal transfer ATPase n=1 Tax=Mycoplasmopsis cynos TaxID=171284 RepID=UPI0030CE3BFB
MLQAKRLKNRKTKLTKWITMQNAAEFFAVVLVSLGLSTLIFLDINILWAKWLTFLIFVLLFGILILPTKNNIKVYKLLWYGFIYWLSPKKYSHRKKDRKTLELNPFSRLIGDDIVLNKKVLGDTFFSKANINDNMFAVFKIYGHNIWAEDLGTQEAYIENLARTFDTFKNKFSFVCLTGKISFRENVNFLKNKKVKAKYVKYVENNLKDFELIKTNTEINNYYLIVNAPNFELLQTETDGIYGYFQNAKVSLEKLEGVELLRFLNKYRSFNVNDSKIKEFYLNNKDRFFDEKEEDILDELFCYDEVIFKKNYIKINNKFMSIRSINKLPTFLDDGWINDILSIQGKIIWNNYPYIDSDKTNKLLDKAKMNIDNDLIIDEKTTQLTRHQQDDRAVIELIDQINLEEYVLLDTNFLIIAEADSLSELREIEKQNDQILRKNKIDLNNLAFRQFEGFVDSSLSINYKLEKEAYQMSTLNLAKGYPFETESLNDNKNLILGITESANPISLDIFNLNHINRSNHNMIILGTSGMGKSTLVQKIIASNLAINNKAIIIDPQDEYSAFANKFEGTVIDLGSGINTSFNILQIRNSIKDDVEEINIRLLINSHLSFLEKFFKIMWNLENYEWMFLQNLFKEFYERKGVFNLKTIKDVKDQDWWTISDFIHFLKIYDCRHLFDYEAKTKLLNRFIELLIFNFENNGRYEMLFNKPTNINTNNDLIVFNMKNLIDTSDTIAAKLGILIVLNICNEIIYDNFIQNEKIKANYIATNKVKLLSAEEIDRLIKRTILCIDEEHIYIDVNNPTTLDYITQITKTIRKFDGSTIHTTQNPSDYKTSPLVVESASRIIQNCNYSVFFGLKDADIEAVQLLYKNSSQLLKNEIRYLAQKQKGKVLLSVDSNTRLKLKLYYSQYEKELFFKKGY